METQEFSDGEHQANDHQCNYQTALRREQVANIIYREQVAEMVKQNWDLLDEQEAGMNF